MVPVQLMEQLSSLKERKTELESQNAELHVRTPITRPAGMV